MRYEVYRVRAEAHNTLVIHPDASAGHDLDAQTVVERFSGKQEDSFAIMDLSTAFKTYTNSVRRGIRMQDGKSGILIRDEIDLKSLGYRILVYADQGKCSDSWQYGYFNPGWENHDPSFRNQCTLRFHDGGSVQPP